ncbi:MAG TPA: hypothetical protein VI702_05390, partial [Nitrospiria bacterium]
MKRRSPVPAHLDFSKLRTYPLKSRKSKVSLKEFGKPHRGGITAFLRSLPDVLGARDLRAVIEAIIAARKKNRPV